MTNKNKKYYSLILAVVLVMGLFLSFNFALAEDGDGNGGGSDIYNDTIKDQLDTLSEIGLPGEEGEGAETLTDSIVEVIITVLNVLGLIFLILIIYAGVRWMTAAGNTDSIEQAKKIIVSAVIGLIIVFLAYAITAFVFTVILG